MKRSVRYLFLIVWFLTPVLTWAQNDSLKLNKYFISKCLHDSKKLVTAPFHWNGKDWKNAGIFVAGTAALTLADQPVADFVMDSRVDVIEKISKNVIGPFGAEYGIGVIAGFFAHGILADNSKSMSTSLLAGESLALATVFVQIPKRLFGRWRPHHYPEATAYDWKGPFNGNSFPSGHTMAAFSIASVIATQYKDMKWVPVVSYSLASLVGISRVYDNRHWLSDVAAGAVLGTMIGKMVCKVQDNRKISIVPYKTNQYQGLFLSIAM